MIFLLIGPPGSGKGTQAKRLASKYGLIHLSTGDMLRSAISDETEMGRKAQAYMLRGEYVPDEVVVALIAERIGRSDCTSGFILDGFPRTLPQALALQQLLDVKSLNITRVFYFKVSNDIILERLSLRRVCAHCGAGYHLAYIPPKDGKTCDACGEVLEQRSDDNPDVIAKRLEVYYLQTAPLISAYFDKGLAKEIDASATQEKVFNQLVESLEVN